ncbi:bifunctional folylpolyglutamate synthase/dihydrofolate synthase [Dethiobacter alkaliphilus]|uniref:tetrahydrofolate synthase n=1 Tax=Dethiobacter alkaliphilus AHT 1 TaxID=555088 RepID=C0GEY6_DETAL|nr:folylpolyglutamate synthase/dihydrofolate synthase family protein [Dethiobacter alkaliphilus]EEG78168.1 FolC bifunctional protein [Dethiobacter alkaliphilus AHT 1]
MNYNEAIDWIHSLYRFGINPGLERITELLRRLEDPQKKIRCIHIAGTNGKGSTAAFLASMLEAQGLQVGLYTSPYLEAFTNRMAINGGDIDENRLAELVTQIRRHVEEISQTEAGQPTEFEVVTALAFLYFAEEQPDWVIMEVGLGGRLDATNVIEPAVSVLTNIGLEHTQVLGDTISAIAFEKAGIIKPSTPAVTAAEKEDALQVFRSVAVERGATLVEMDRDFGYEQLSASLDGQVFNYWSRQRKLDNLQISLLGPHQVRNAALAVATRELLPVPLDTDAIYRGLAAAKWPGRLEVFSRRPLVLVDGAHNIDGIKALKSALDTILDGRPLRLVLGILGDKAVDEILSLIVPLATAGLIVTKPDNPRASNPREVAELARRYTSAPVAATDTVEEAVALGLAQTGEEEALCISGSLYTISEAREVLKKHFL